MNDLVLEEGHFAVLLSLALLEREHGQRWFDPVMLPKEPRRWNWNSWHVAELKSAGYVEAEGLRFRLSKTGRDLATRLPF